MLVIRTAAAAALLVIATAAAAEGPVRNISPQLHPELAAAQGLVADAFDRITLAQRHYDDHLGGHAERAKQLLAEASEEMKAAAVTANRH